MKDYGEEYPIIRRIPSLSTIAAVLAMAAIIFVCQTFFMSTLADVASGPAAHSVSIPSAIPPSSPNHPHLPESHGVAKLDDSGFLARIEE